MSTFCLGCGNSLAEGERYCGVCGRDSQGSAVAVVDPQVAYGLSPETSGKAIFSFISGVLFLILPFSVVAVVFGHISLYDIRKSAGRLKGRGLAITGIILGYVGVAVILSLIGLGIYGASRERRASRMPRGTVTTSTTLTSVGENSVVSSLRTLNMAEISYSQAHKDSGYTCSLTELSSSWGLSDELTHGRKHGYVFELRGCKAGKGMRPISKYQLIARPGDESQRGFPAFCSDESYVIRIARNGSVDDCVRSGSDLSESDLQHPQTLFPKKP